MTQEDMSMAEYTNELREAFFTGFPTELCVQMCRTIVATYRTAFDYSTEEYPEAQARNLFPYLKLAMVDRNISALLKRENGIKVRDVLNGRGNSYHILAASGKIMLTSSSVPTPNAMVRESLFREAYAMSAQLNLFEENPLPPPDSQIYAILLHGPAGKPLREPEFISLGFPDKGFNCYVTSVNLLDTLADYRENIFAAPDLVAAPTPTVAVTVAEDVAEGTPRILKAYKVSSDD